MQCTLCVAIAGYLSYPRTESSAYPPNTDLRGTAAELRGHPVYGEYVAGLLAAGACTAQVVDGRVGGVYVMLATGRQQGRCQSRHSSLIHAS